LIEQSSGIKILLRSVPVPLVMRELSPAPSHPNTTGDGFVRNYYPVLSFGEEVAEAYDDFSRGDERETVAFLEELARGGPVLELAIGTGRIALPLAFRGLVVHGIDLSPAMVAQLRRKPGGDRVDVTIGDFADVPVAAPTG
jgi:SAM-dependent methyltransferase